MDIRCLLTRLTAATALLFAVAETAAAQQPTLHDDLLDRLVGRWTMTGTIAGKDTTHDVDADWTLNHQFVRVHEVSRERDADGRPQYEATAFIGWHAARGRYVCLWLDAFGGGFAGTGFAEKSGEQLPFVFGDSDTAFHNTMAFDAAADGWTWQMENEQKGRREPFARLHLTRIPAASRP